MASRAPLLAIAAVLAAGPAAGAGTPPPDATGSGALALAARVGAEDPALPPADRETLAALLDGGADRVAKAAPVTVAARSVVCRAGNVDIALHICEIAFAGGTRALAGRAAQALYATLLGVGGPRDGAGGTIYAAIRDLSCRIDPKGIAARDGGGASCDFKRTR